MKAHQRRGEGQRVDRHRTVSKQMNKRQEGQQWAGDKPLPEVGQVADCRLHILGQ
jgi:hypothetical protein